MSKNILILLGSPRRGGNSDALAEAFAKGAQAKGHAVTLFDASKNISGCRACYTCWSKGRACTFTDAFTDLEPLLEQADTLVLSTPVYWFGFTAQLKAAIDRMYSYTGHRVKPMRPLKIKEAVLLVCAGGPAEYPQLFTCSTLTFELMTQSQNWRNAGVLTVGDVIEKGDVMKKDGYVQAEQLGLSL